MAAEPNIISRDEISKLADRLTGHAEAITNTARHDIANDLRLSAAALRRLVVQDRTLRREIARIVAGCADKAAGSRLLELIGVDGGDV